MATCKAGCSAFRKLLRRYPGYTLVSAGSAGGHMNLIDPCGEPVRLHDGRKLTIASSPRVEDRAAQELARRLESLGIRRAA